jgi:hypothetical protein
MKVAYQVHRKIHIHFSTCDQGISNIPFSSKYFRAFVASPWYTVCPLARSVRLSNSLKME